MYEKYTNGTGVQRVIRLEDYVTKIQNIRDTVRSLEGSLVITRSLEAERWLRYSNLKTENKVMMDDLRNANKRNKNMLNLFRQSVTDIRMGREIALPEPLKKEVQRTWHQKYDALLTENKQLKQDLNSVNSQLKDKIQEVNDLHKRLLSLGEKLVERNEAVMNICTKYLTLKKRKDSQEIQLRGCIGTLQDELKKFRCESIKTISTVSPSIKKKASSTQETKRKGSFTCEKSLLKNLLQKVKRSKAHEGGRITTVDKVETCS